MRLILKLYLMIIKTPENVHKMFLSNLVDLQM